MEKNTKNAVLEAKKIQDIVHKTAEEMTSRYIKEGFNENIMKLINESPEDDDEYEEITSTEETQDEPDGTQDVTDTEEVTDVEEDPETGDESVEDIEGEDENEFPDDFAVDDETYDFTDADSEDVLKVFKAMNGNSDKLIIVKNGDELTIDDKETGAEYIVKGLNGADSAPETDFDVTEEDTEYEVNEANLGYKTTYQDKDVLDPKGLKNEIPKGKKTLDKGVPSGTGRHVGKVGVGKPFTENEDLEGEQITEEDVPPVDENPLDEAGLTRTKGNLRQRVGVKSTPQVQNTVGIREPQVRDGAQLKSENKLVQLESDLKRIKNDNIVLKEAVRQFQEVAQSYYIAAKDAMLVNHKLGKIVNLFTENSTTSKEKASIIERLDKTKSRKEVDALYESIKLELKNKQPITENIDKEIIVERPTVKNDKTIYVSEDVKRIKELMTATNNCRY